MRSEKSPAPKPRPRAKNLNLPNEKVRLLTHNVGGSFGMKNISYPEYMCILHAAKELGRPVKWTDERSTSFLSDSHGRAQDIQAELALAIGRDCGQIVLITAALCTTFAVIAAARGRWEVMDFWATDALDVDKYGQIARNWRLHYQYLQARARWHSLP